MMVRRERDELRREKEEQVTALTAKLHSVERSYDIILQVRMMYMFSTPTHLNAHSREGLEPRLTLVPMLQLSP